MFEQGQGVLMSVLYLFVVNLMILSVTQSFVVSHDRVINELYMLQRKEL
jgi:hypothetical protein